MSKEEIKDMGFIHFYNIIDGQQRGSKKFHQGIDPSSLKQLWDVPIASAGDLEEAVLAARKAFGTWSTLSVEKRQHLIAKLRQALLSRHEEMAHLLMTEVGKPKPFAALEVTHACDFLNFYSTQKMPEEEVIQDDENLHLSQRYVPIGIVGAICPWNFPLVLAMGKIAAALLTGNTVIVKPSPFTPYSILKFVELAQQILPAGVLQALHGDDTLGPSMVEHPGIAKITFTGSIGTGKKIMASASRTLKNVTLELGGNSATIVCPDVDIEKVAPQVALGAFFNSGQFCAATKRLFVHKDIYGRFLQAMSNVVNSWKVGPVSMDGITLGPVQNKMQYDIVKGFFKDSHDKGYKFAVGGQINDADGYVIHPAIVDNPPDDSRIVKEEPFGPILPILSWSTEDEVIERVNNIDTGLGGAVWSGDMAQAQRLSRRIEAGTIWINSFEKPLPQGYFTGHKQSGVGGEWGKHGLLSYCNVQSVHQYKESVAASNSKTTS